MTTHSLPLYHWNYFLAISQDLEKLSRYIDFSKSNFNTYSIELTHLLLSSSAEIDVVMKQLCQIVCKNRKVKNINEYRVIIRNQIQSLIFEDVRIDRYGLKFTPWEKWDTGENPDWWRSYNEVKHERNIHFKQANLINTINSIGALLITIVYYYKFAFSEEKKREISITETTEILFPHAEFIKLKPQYYEHPIYLY